MNFEEMVQRTVNAEAKAGLRSCTMVQDSKICCSKDYHPFNNTASKVQTQGTIAKDSLCPEKPKAKETKSVRANAVEPFKLAKKKNKQNKLKH